MANGSSPLLLALSLHNIELARLMIENGADPNIYHDLREIRPLMHVSRWSDPESVEIARLLID